MKQKILIFTIILLILFTFTPMAFGQIKDGEYEVKVSLWKKYEDSPSMGNNALTSKAKLTVIDGTSSLEVRFVPLETMGFVGYLGELLVEGKSVTVKKYYDNYDEYNDPNTGVDQKMKGKKYPMIMEFPYNPTKEFTDVTVYVPVMGSMGFGTQDARLRLDINDLKKFQSMTGETTKDPVDTPKEPTEVPKEEVGQKEDLKPGLYKVPIKLWHSVENKPSMGNGALAQVSELEVDENGIAYLYVGSDTMEVSNIVASLVNLYYETETGDYKASERNAFELEIPEEAEKRPKVFKMPILKLTQYLNVMVDPKVEPMGDNPIRARLQLDLNKLTKIKESKSTLKKLFEKGTKKPIFDPNVPGKRQNKSIWVEFPGNTFDQEFTFYANKIMGEEADTMKDNFNPLDIVQGYNIEFLGPLMEIKKDETNVQGTREKYEPKKKIKVKIPVKGFTDKDKVKLYDMNGGKKELPFQIKDGFIEFETKRAGDFAIVKSMGASGTNSPLVPLSNSGQTTGSTPTSRGQAFLNSVKKSKSSPVKTTGGTTGGSSTNSLVATPSSSESASTSINLPAPSTGQVVGDVTGEEGNVEELNQETLDHQSPKSKERVGLIFFILVLIGAMIGTSLFIIKKYYGILAEELDENKRLIWRAKNEKNL
ncbi:MAG: NEAT domain-containing protein [Tissierellia bacterium]|nr:NEAT domain-containing protein [Tissierellia bacterium]